MPPLSPTHAFIDEANLWENAQPSVLQHSSPLRQSLALIPGHRLVIIHSKPHVPHCSLQETHASLGFLEQRVAASEFRFRCLPVFIGMAKQVLRLLEAEAHFAEDGHQVWQLVEVQGCECLRGPLAHLRDDPSGYASRVRQLVVATADAVVGSAVVLSEGGTSLRQ